jgi:hypothetical protein
LKVSPSGLGSTTERPHLRALINKKQTETKISLDSIKAEKFWYNMASVKRGKSRQWDSSGVADSKKSIRERSLDWIPARMMKIKNHQGRAQQ